MRLRAWAEAAIARLACSHADDERCIGANRGLKRVKLPHSGKGKRPDSRAARVSVAPKRGALARVAAYCKLTGMTTYMNSVPDLMRPGLLEALSSMMTSFSGMTLRASVMKVGLKPISMSSPS